MLMENLEKQLIADLRDRRIGLTEFEEKFPVNVYDDKAYITVEIERAIENRNEEELELTIYLLWLSEQYEKQWKPDVDILNKLLLVPYHKSHQMIAKALQKIKSPSSVPFIRKALESKFDYLAYTCSDSDAISKWFSWALLEIGTKEAIDLMREYSHSSDEGIRNEMLYRLKRVEDKKAD